MPNNEWSEWFDFNQELLSKIPQIPGVYMMHKNMKMLFIGCSENIKKSIDEDKSKECISKASRFRYKEDEDYEKSKNELIENYKKRHEGNFPECMK
jgi:abortive infection bacteriophage resistance protein